jgi:pimeloyl-ACP methyl ester carboxylesterase
MLTVAAVVLVALFRSAWPEPVEQGRRLFRRVIGGLWLGLAGWVAGAVLQAWVPLWQMLILGATLSVLSGLVLPRLWRYARLAADLLIIVALGVLSAIPVQPVLLIAAAFAFAAVGFGLDWIRSSLFSPRLSPLLLAAPAVLVLVLGLQVRQPGTFGSRLLEEDPLFPLRLALVIPSAGERLPLQNGTGAWLLETPLDEPRGTAIVLHGNHRLGSQQPSGLVLQGALVSAGFDVLSVDHPGFGASVAPPASADWRAWDPTLGAVDALRYLRDRDDDASTLETIVVGHSMGVDVALKLAADGASVGALYLWGGALDRPYGPNWVSGFHRERNIPCCLPPSSLDRIRSEFYGGGDRFAAALPEPHAPVHFVRFGIEHADVARDREPLYAAISEPKRVCDFSSVSHYFNTLAIRGFVLIDTLTVRRTAEIFHVGCSDRRAGAASPTSSSSAR